jgi:hypothetical protein
VKKKIQHILSSYQTNNIIPIMPSASSSKSSASSSGSTRNQKKREMNLRFLEEQIRKDMEDEAAARGESLSVNPQQIQAQAQFMVQAATQAKAVVKAEKSRGALLEMDARQVAALSQTQALEIINYNKRRNSLNTSSSLIDHDTQVHIQAQALDHAYTQALMNAGLYIEDSILGESTPLLSNSKGTNYGNQGLLGRPSGTTTTSPIHSSWLRKLNAAIVVAVVVILAVHYTNTSEEVDTSYAHPKNHYYFYGLGRSGTVEGYSKPGSTGNIMDVVAFDQPTTTAAAAAAATKDYRAGGAGGAWL